MMIERKVNFGPRKVTHRGTPRPSKVVSRVPRVARLMALAIRMEHLIREGLVADQSELAQLGNVTRARLTQIMNLLFLAPDIQEHILLLELTAPGRALITERQLRPVCATFSWKKQREQWEQWRGSVNHCS